MDRLEFLDKLKEALMQDLGEQAVQENVTYYNQYMNDEIKSGKSEAEVIDMLGDPWIIARTIIDTQSEHGCGCRGRLRGRDANR